MGPQYIGGHDREAQCSTNKHCAIRRSASASDASRNYVMHRFINRCWGLHGFTMLNAATDGDITTIRYTTSTKQIGSGLERHRSISRCNHRVCFCFYRCSICIVGSWVVLGGLPAPAFSRISRSFGLYDRLCITWVSSEADASVRAFPPVVFRWPGSFASD